MLVYTTLSVLIIPCTALAEYGRHIACVLRTVPKSHQSSLIMKKMPVKVASPAPCPLVSQAPSKTTRYNDAQSDLSGKLPLNVRPCTSSVPLYAVPLQSTGKGTSPPRKLSEN